jgi:hypothetical protein
MRRPKTLPWPTAWTVLPERIDEAIRIVTDGRYKSLDEALAQLENVEEVNSEELPEPVLLCQCGHYIWTHVTTPERHGCFPPEGCDCRDFRESERKP